MKPCVQQWFWSLRIATCRDTIGFPQRDLGYSQTKARFRKGWMINNSQWLKFLIGMIIWWLSFVRMTEDIERHHLKDGRTDGRDFRRRRRRRRLRGFSFALRLQQLCSMCLRFFQFLGLGLRRFLPPKFALSMADVSSRINIVSVFFFPPFFVNFPQYWLQ